jgi:hypothetical protein
MVDSSDGPTPPNGLPDEVATQLQELTAEELRKTIIHAQELLKAEAERGPTIEPQPGEDILDVTEYDGYTEVVKRIPCGEDCSDCPHGPYLYHVREETLPNGETELHWEFLGATYTDTT